MDTGNTSYIFIPLALDSAENFAGLCDALQASSAWATAPDEITYMLKYVADKVASPTGGRRRCVHYRLAAAHRQSAGLAGAGVWYATKSYTHQGEKTTFRFKIPSVELYCFKTGIGVLAFQLTFENSDPLWVAAAQYYLKKVSREIITPELPDGGGTTLLELAKKLMAPFESVAKCVYFEYANPDTERANVLTYLEVPARPDYDRELFYLRRCYNDGFLYTVDEEQQREEIYTPSQDVVWGISPEAAVCLACTELGRGDFLRDRFYKNFNQQYLFMYVLLLHQKYMLYHFLMQVSVDTYKDMDTLERYRSQLYEFETEFVFSCVTEVPQYQMLYERMSRAFALKQMFEDVHEPLVSLSEVRREDSDKKQKRRDDDVNRALFILSLLSFFSALVDSFDFTDSFFGWFLNDTGVRIVQVVCIVLIVVMILLVFINLIRSKRDR